MNYESLRIAYISPRYIPFAGGVETHVTQIATRMTACGHQVEVLTEERDRSLPRIEVIEGVRVRRFPVILPEPVYPFAAGLWRYLARQRSRYDLVHAHNYHAFPALGAALLGARPLVFTPHYHGTGHRPLGRLLHAPYRLAGRLIFRRSDCVICVSQTEAELVRCHFPFVSRRVTVIPNGVEATALRQAEPYAEDRRVILTVGRLLAYKNVDRVIEAVAYLDDSVALCVIGEGPARASLEALVGELGLGGRVRFLGRVEEGVLHRWFRTAAVYVGMSAEEAFGLTILEALTAGTAVVAADIPAHREVVAGAGSDSVVLLPVDSDAEVVASAIRELAGRLETGPAPTIPSWDEVAGRTLEVYQRVVSREREL